ncbi:MAG: type II toxin-antitoxin system RelE/ParE family toxin [Bacteroidales bacterium]|jgi:plasmid stabilization system protein ParE|nr:type II toxin-antitoxin system RelE/ParE family toxin [Bacteroidales bacterium]
MAQIIWTELARSDVENIFHYYETISSLLAETIVDEIFDSVYYLKKMPEIGAKEPLFSHLRRNYRYLIVRKRYKLIYLYENNKCFILMVWDCKNNPELLRKSISI